MKLNVKVLALNGLEFDKKMMDKEITMFDIYTKITSIYGSQLIVFIQIILKNGIQNQNY